eukprot:403342313
METEKLSNAFQQHPKQENVNDFQNKVPKAQMNNQNLTLNYADSKIQLEVSLSRPTESRISSQLSQDKAIIELTIKDTTSKDSTMLHNESRYDDLRQTINAESQDICLFDLVVQNQSDIIFKRTRGSPSTVNLIISNQESKIQFDSLIKVQTKIIRKKYINQNSEIIQNLPQKQTKNGITNPDSKLTHQINSNRINKINDKNQEKELFLHTMDKLLTQRLSQKDKSNLFINQKDSVIFSGQKEHKNQGHSLSPFSVKLSKNSPSIFNHTQQYLQTNKSKSSLRIGQQRPQNSIDPNKRGNMSEQKQMPPNSNEFIEKSYLNKGQNNDIQSKIIENNSNQSIQNQGEDYNQDSNEQEQKEEKIDLDTFIEDTFISNMQQLGKLKKKLIECTREYRQYTFTHSPRKHHSRIIDSLGLNPLSKMSNKISRISKDPNIVYLDINCSDKYGGARDIIEIKVNKSPPLLLNSRLQTHYELQYSNYTGLLNSLTERNSGITNGQIMLTKLQYQLSTQTALRSLSKDAYNKFAKKSSLPWNNNEQQKAEMNSTSIKNDEIKFDFGFPDSSKSYLQTLEEFSSKIFNYDNFKPIKEQGNFYEIQSKTLNKAYKIDQNQSLIDQTNLQKILLEIIPNYKECLMRLMKLMPVSGCVMHQLTSFLMYQLDRMTRVINMKDINYLDAIQKLEDQNKQLKQQINGTKELTYGYQKLESDYHNLSERYQKRIEQSQEVAEILSKDIFDLQYNFRNTSNLQIDSQDELQKKLESLIKQFTMDREQNSFKIGELKTFLDQNIAMLKNNWEDKRDKECQTQSDEILQDIYGNQQQQSLVSGINFNNASFNQSFEGTNLISNSLIGNPKAMQANLWDIVDQFINQNKLRQKFEVKNKLVTYKEYLTTTEEIIRYGLKQQANKEFSKYQQVIMDYFLDKCDNTSLDYMLQATSKITNYCGLVVPSTMIKYCFQFKSENEQFILSQIKAIDLSHIHKLIENYVLALDQCLIKKKNFNDTFPIGDVYENRDRQSESYTQSKFQKGFDPIQINHLFYRVLQKDQMDAKNKEQDIQNIQKVQFIQMLQNQIVINQDNSLEEVPDHIKAINLIISQIEFNKLIKKDKATCFSYDNLIGNFKDSQIGKKIKSQIFQEFFYKNNPERDFYESFYSQRDAVFQDNLVDTKFKMISTQPVPVHTKFQTPGRQGTISKIWKKDTTRAREALSRIVKRISILKRLNIIRRVNEVIVKVCDNPYDEQRISFKKVVKIFNLCHIYIPLMQVKSNNSTDLSLDIKDMIELTTNKDKHKRFVQFISPLEVSCLLAECYYSHILLRENYLKNIFFDKLKTDYSGLVRPQLEKFLFEEVGIDNLNESHKVLFKIMMTKLKSKIDSPGVITKAIINEQKVIYKYKDIEEEIIRKIASETVMDRINSTQIMKIINSIAEKVRENKIVVAKRNQKHNKNH